MKSTFVAAALLFIAVAAPAQAGDAAADKIAKQLGLKTENIRPSPISGIYEIQHEHEFAYVSADGRYLLRGDLVDLKSGEELTEAHRRSDRLDVIGKLGQNKLIEFAPAPPQVAKYTITVFTDVDCGYCRKLHSEIAQYNAQGIAIRYAFFPRSGPDTDSWRTAEAVWCSADRQKALTEAKTGAAIKVKGKLCDNPIAEEYQLAQDLGIRGTPMMVFPNGEVFPGYIPATALAQKLAEVAAKSKG